MLGCVATLLHRLANLIDPHPLTDEDMRKIADTVWTDTDCSLFHGYAED